MAEKQEDKILKKTSIGGQALIEGVMMRGPEKTSMAVRHVSGEIVMESWPTSGKDRAAIWKVPLIRGVYNLIDSMRFGYKCLMRSAELSGIEDEEDEGKEPAKPAIAVRQEDNAPPAVSVTDQDNMPAPDTAPAVVMQEAGETLSPQREDANKAEKKEGFAEKYLMPFLMVLSSLLGIVLAVFLFMWLPSQLSNWLKPVAPVLDNWVVRSIFEGVLKIIIFVGYVLLVSMMKDIRRVFQYHGAEHKTIFCYEKGLDLTVENVRKQIRFHPRCGTSFMVLMLLVGIIVTMFIHVDNAVLRSLIKILTLPIIVGIGYELIKLAGRKDNILTRIISAPGLWVQRITTKEPDDSMIECAIAALKDVIPADPEADKW